MTDLFVKLGAIGDVVQAGVATIARAATNPGLPPIDWVVGSRLVPLVSALGVARRVIGVDDESLLSSSRNRQLQALAGAVRAIGLFERYDRVLTAYQDARYGLLTRLVRARQRVSYGERLDRPALIQHRSRVHEYWRLLGGGDATPIDIPAASRAMGSALAARFSADSPVALPPRYVVLCPGGARNLHRDDPLRRWPLQNFVAVAQALRRRNIPVVLVGGGADTAAVAAFDADSVIDLVGRTSLAQLMGVLERASAIVANDSGVLHLAALTEAGLVALFGPTPANAVVPFGRERLVVLDTGNRVSCSPCYDGRNYAACPRNRCMEAITVDAVLRGIDAVALETLE